MEASRATARASETYEGVGIVAFLDLLGFAAQVEAHWGSDLSPLPNLLAIKGEAERGPVTVAIKDRPEPIVKISTMSDSLIVGAALPSEPLDAADLMLPVFSMLATIRVILNSAATRGFAVRGGVELGPIYWSPSEFIGPAFNHAYKLESKIAKSARVLLGPRLVEHIGEQSSVVIEMLRPQYLLYPTKDQLCAVRPYSDLPGLLEPIRAKCLHQAHAEKYDEVINYACTTPAFSEAPDVWGAITSRTRLLLEA